MPRNDVAADTIVEPGQEIFKYKVWTLAKIFFSSIRHANAGFISTVRGVSHRQRRDVDDNFKVVPGWGNF